MQSAGGAACPAGPTICVGQKKPGTGPGFESFGRGCLKGTSHMQQAWLLCKCESLIDNCIKRN